MELLPTYRLSVIIANPAALPIGPKMSRRGMIERAVRSVLEQTDPIGTEIIVADENPTDETKDYLKSVFPEAVAAARLNTVECTRTGDPAKTRHEAVSRSTGTFLSFLEPDDWWRPGHLARLEPLLQKHDLIVATEDPVMESSDWLRTFLLRNPGLRSSIVIRRTLFEEIKGFPEGYSGIVLPKKLPGTPDYALCLKALMHLMKEEKQERFLMIQNQHVVIEMPVLPPQIGNMQNKVRELKEAFTLMNLARKIPKRYWVTLAKRLKDSSSKLIKK